MEEREALLRVTLIALDNEKFRAEWEAAVRDGADAACAQVVGMQLAGHSEGMVEWFMPVPGVPGMNSEDATAAYLLAVKNTAQERLDRMNPGTERR